MPSQAGTLTLQDLKAERFKSIVEYGEDTIVEVLQRDLAAHNAIVQMMVAELCAVSSDRQRVYGTSADGEMVEADEFDRGVAVKNVGGSAVAFPLHKFMRNVGWTNEYMLSMTPADLAESVLGVQSGHVRAIERRIRRALFTPTNYTFRDSLVVPTADLAVKALVNADSAPIPNGPSGEVFNAATHTHYSFFDGAAPTQAAALTLIDNVVEHGHGSRVVLGISRSAEQTVRAFAQFVAYADPRVVLRNTDAPGTALDISRIDNRAIGILGAAEVWVKSWIPAGYALVYDAGEMTKPLIYREHPIIALRGLRVAARIANYPLYADVMEAYFGVGVWNRTGAAALYYAAAADAYVAPTL